MRCHEEREVKELWVIEEAILEGSPSGPASAWHHTDHRWPAQVNSSEIPDSQNQEQNKMIVFSHESNK